VIAPVLDLHQYFRQIVLFSLPCQEVGEHFCSSADLTKHPVQATKCVPSAIRLAATLPGITLLPSVATATAIVEALRARADAKAADLAS
jgi:hypothetical protein